MGHPPIIFKKTFQHTFLLHKGLTLVELVMIVLIIGILAVVAIPRFEIYHEIKLQSAAKKLVADIRYAQNKAMSRHCDTRIVFDNVNDTYQGEYCDADCATSANWHALRDPSSGTALSMDYDTDSQFSGVDIASVDFGATDTLRFNWQGVPQNSAGTVLAAAGTLTMLVNGRSLTVTVTPQTGKIQVQ